MTGWNPTSMPRREAQFTPLLPDFSETRGELEAADDSEAGMREEA